MPESVTVVETPRDAFQGLKGFIPTEEKIRYIQSLVDAGFKHIDLGSFVSPKAVPQMADSEEVVKAFHAMNSVERIAIFANRQGMERAFAVGGLDALGFPFSLSRQFQIQNTKMTTTQTWPLLDKFILEIEQHDMSFILYLSMAFGNPYGEPWDEEALFRCIKTLTSMGVRHISLADTVAVAKPDQVARVFKRAITEFPQVQFSAHLHGRPQDWFECVEAALQAGCRRFDAAAAGLGGCPFAQDQLVSNIPSNELIERLESRGCSTGVQLDKLRACAALAQDLQQRYSSAS